MNFHKVQRKNRKAISPVLATVILIAITLIAAIAIAGFVFGLFGSFTNTPQLQVNNALCYGLPAVSPTHVECALLLQNTGSGNAGIPGGACNVVISGAATSGAMWTASGGTGTTVTSVTGNTAPTTLYCYVISTTPGPSGSTATGNIVTANGNIAFSGTWK